MSKPFKSYNSPGIPVTAAVTALIREGDGSRDKFEWADAALFYGKAVAAAPELRHIWIQLGHALKEAGDMAGSYEAYQDAERLLSDSEVKLHLGHLSKIMGDDSAALRNYLEAYRRDNANVDAFMEVHRLIASGAPVGEQEALEALRLELSQSAPKEQPRSSIDQTVNEARDVIGRLQNALEAIGSSTVSAGLGSVEAILSTIEAKLAEDKTANGACKATAALVFDASDLIGYYRHARLPTGIQRVQIETITRALRAEDGRNVRVCCFIDGREDWLEVAPDTFLHLADLSVQSDDRTEREWIAALNRMYLELRISDPFVFPQNAVLVNLGTSWWLQNYFLYIRHAKAMYNIRYIPLVYDLIPVRTPEHCIKGLTQDFISWLIGIFLHADFYLTISEATRQDLLAMATTLGHEVDPTSVRVIPLDADFRKPLTHGASQDELSVWRLDRRPYVLLVSTVESRKGHLTAFDAWTKLIQRNGIKNVPMLVCVGKRGWLSDAIYNRLSLNAELQSRVLMLQGLSDGTLDLLYKRCLFTIYPSLYEGWGLPVTESLCYGKVPLISNSSSLPEAGGSFAVYFESGSSDQLADKLEHLISDDTARQQLEKAIREEFVPRSWYDIALQIYGNVDEWAASGRPIMGVEPPEVALGRYYPMDRNVETRIWRGLGSAEIFRTGLGWWWPEAHGCWTHQEGGVLELTLPATKDTSRVYLFLQGIPEQDTIFTITDLDSHFEIEGGVPALARKWVFFDVPSNGMERRRLRLRLRGYSSIMISTSVGESKRERPIYVGWAGLFVAEVDDAVSRANFIEAITLDALPSLSAYADRN